MTDKHPYNPLDSNTERQTFNQEKPQRFIPITEQEELDAIRRRNELTRQDLED